MTFTNKTVGSQWYTRTLLSTISCPVDMAVSPFLCVDSTLSVRGTSTSLVEAPCPALPWSHHIFIRDGIPFALHHWEFPPCVLVTGTNWKTVPSRDEMAYWCDSLQSITDILL